MTVPLGLVLDTTLKGVAAAVFRLDAPESPLVTLALHPENAGSVQAIAGLVQRVLDEAHVAPEQLGGVVVGHGPGSFTGIKVGLAFVYGWQTALPELRVHGASALDAVAAELARAPATDGARSPSAPVAVFLPATKTHGFVAVRRPDGAAAIDAQLVDAGDAKALSIVLSRIPLDATHVVVEGWPLLEAGLQAENLKPRRLTARDALSRALAGLARAGARAWPDGYAVERPGPRYLRLSTAEERLQAAP